MENEKNQIKKLEDDLKFFDERIGNIEMDLESTKAKSDKMGELSAIKEKENEIKNEMKILQEKENVQISELNALVDKVLLLENEENKFNNFYFNYFYFFLI